MPTLAAAAGPSKRDIRYFILSMSLTFEFKQMTRSKQLMNACHSVSLPLNLFVPSFGNFARTSSCEAEFTLLALKSPAGLDEIDVKFKMSGEVLMSTYYSFSVNPYYRTRDLIRNFTWLKNVIMHRFFAISEFHIFLSKDLSKSSLSSSKIRYCDSFSCNDGPKLPIKVPICPRTFVT